MYAIQIQFGSCSDLTWHVHGEPMRPEQLGAIRGRVDGHDQGEKRATAAPTPTDHSTADPGGVVSNKIREVANPIVQPTSVKPTRTERSTRKTDPEHKRWIDCHHNKRLESSRLAAQLLMLHAVGHRLQIVQQPGWSTGR